MLVQNCQICGHRRKTLKYAGTAQIREFCESCEKVTALIIDTKLF